SFLCTPPPTASPLFPYTTLFRSDFAAADLGERLRHEDAEQRLGVFLPGAVVIREPAVQAEPREDVIPKRVEFGQDENGVDLWRRSEEHTSELQSRFDLVCRLLLE